MHNFYAGFQIIRIGRGNSVYIANLFIQVCPFTYKYVNLIGMPLKIKSGSRYHMVFDTNIIIIIMTIVQYLQVMNSSSSIETYT